MLKFSLLSNFGWKLLIDGAIWILNKTVTFADLSKKDCWHKQEIAIIDKKMIGSY